MSMDEVRSSGAGTTQNNKSVTGLGSDNNDIYGKQSALYDSFRLGYRIEDLMTPSSHSCLTAGLKFIVYIHLFVVIVVVVVMVMKQ